MLSHADCWVSLFAHAEGHVGVRFGRLALLELIGQFIADRCLDFVDLAIKDVQVGHPDIVGVPGDLRFCHPEWTDAYLMDRPLIGESIRLAIGTTHRKGSAQYRDHVDLRLRMLNLLRIPLHLFFRGRFRLGYTEERFRGVLRENPRAEQ